MYKMSLLANFVFCVFYYIKKELTWLFKKKKKKKTQMLTSQLQRSVDLGWDPGTYIFWGRGKLPWWFLMLLQWKCLGLAVQEVRLFLWNTELIQCNSAAMRVMDHSMSASIATAEWTQRLPK